MQKANILEMLAFCSFHYQLCVNLIEQDYLNFAETKSEKPSKSNPRSRFASGIPPHSWPDLSHGLAGRTKKDGRKGKKATSRTIIRATWLRLLPGLDLWSIYQLVWLGS